MASVLWSLFFLYGPLTTAKVTEELSHYLGEVGQIIFFLLGAMTLVELIDAHRGFTIITDLIRTRKKQKILWLVGFMTFFLSSLLDNLTTTIVMTSLLRKLVREKKERWLLGASVVVAANAGGAWTPIGDVTTTMLWIGHQVTTWFIMKTLFFPSLVCLLISLTVLGKELKGSYEVLLEKEGEMIEPGAYPIFFLGLIALLFVPLAKEWIGLPPFMGILLGLGALWLVTDLVHKQDAKRSYLQVPHILTRIDTSGVLFFLGILLAINALEIMGLLALLASYFQAHLPSFSFVALVMGFLSSIIDNVPLVAATMGMYPLAQYPTNDVLWAMIAYTAGTGGSLLLIGSAAGVAWMGIEKVDFLWYFKKVSWGALLGYLGGFGTYLLLRFVGIA